MTDIFTLAICAVIYDCHSDKIVPGFTTFVRPELRSFLYLPNGIPSLGTLGRLFARLVSSEFEHCFIM